MRDGRAARLGSRLPLSLRLEPNWLRQGRENTVYKVLCFQKRFLRAAGLMLEASINKHHTTASDHRLRCWIYGPSAKHLTRHSYLNCYNPKNCAFRCS